MTRTGDLDPIAVAVAEAHRLEWRAVLAATVRFTRDLDLAEECVQDAYARALVTWRADGVPERPGAWLTVVAKRRALDVLRRSSSLEAKLPHLVSEPEEPAPGERGDDQLRLIFVCCHPALAPEARVALTLRLVCGLTTSEVATAFLVSESTMAARITRAKKKISLAGIPYRVPATDELGARVDAVLAVVHLLFTTGHTAPRGPGLVRTELVERAIDLAEALHVLLPDDAEVAGLLALVLLHDARRTTRTSADGRLLLLEEQDRSRWDRATIDRGLDLVEGALVRTPYGRFVLQAAIAAEHSRAATWSDTDWRRIVSLYDRLVVAWPTDVVALNRAVAVGMAYGPQAGLDGLDELLESPNLRSYSYFPSARAEFLRRLGREAEARDAYEAALSVTDNEVQRRFLLERLATIAS